MTSSEHLRMALARSRWLVGICAVVGVVAMLVIGQLSGDQYQASSSVIVQDNLQSAASAGASPTSSDASTDAANAATLAATPAFARYLASVLHEHDATALQSAITPQQSGTSNVIQFTASASSAARARALADTARTAFPAFSTLVSTAPIAAAERALAAGAADDSQVRASIDRLRVLAGVSGNVTALSSATSATKTKPLLSRELLEGLVAGLVVGLLIMALREGLDTSARVAREIELELDLPVWGLLRRSRGAPSRGEPFSASPRSHRAEALQIVSRLQQRPSSGGTVIAITGPTTAEGRTWVAASVAAALRERSSSVCAIDDGSGVLIDRLRSGSENGGHGHGHGHGNGNGNGTGNGNGNGNGKVEGEGRGSGSGNGNGDGDGEGESHSKGEGEGEDDGDEAALRTQPRHPVVLPAWSAARGLEQLRSRFDWIVVDAPWPSDAPHAVDPFAAADTALLVVTLGTVTREQLAAYGREINAWPRRADAIILTAAR